MSRAILDIWDVTPERDARARILPDGCCDVILVQASGKAPKMMITELGTAPHIAHLRKGTRMRGYRLAPGTGLNATALEDRLSAAEPDQDCAQIIEDASTYEPRL